MKKAFSLIEVIVSITLLSVVMIALLQIRSDNIFLIGKSDEKAKLNDYILLTMNLNEVNNRNKNIFLDKEYNFEDEKLRKELKSVKVKLKDEQVNERNYESDLINFNIRTYTSSYSVDELNKTIYSFKIEL